MSPTSITEARLTAGHRRSHPPPGDEVLITGIAGRFPDSDSVMELQENLFNKVNLISDDDRRWRVIHHDIPQGTGKINHITKFDASFFGVHYQQAHTMDPMARMLLEKTYEAIIDAGVNPNELKNKKVGVFVGVCFSESVKTWLYDNMQVNAFGIVGSSRSMLANRLSQWLGITGPSYIVDTACSSSLTATEHAFRAIRDGLCDSAIVGGCNLCLNPYVSLMFYRLGVLSSDGSCKTFDKSADGYARAEAVAVIYLQKAKDSRRAYAQLLYAKTNCDGYKEHGISYPSRHMQKGLMQEVYEECGLSPTSVEFVEAHGTGTKVGDPEELKAIDEVFCTGREEPLLIGSSKSNFGHTEPAAGICGIAKMCIAYTTGYIPPNIHFSAPQEDMEAILSGRTQVVVEKQPWGRGMSAVSSFGFGGANVHALLKNFARAKVNYGLPADELPRLVCVSGRLESAVNRILDDLESRPLDAELVRLWHAVHDQDIRGHPVRGYTLLRSNKAGSMPSKTQSIARSTSHFSGVRHPVWFVYSGAGSQWPGMAAQFMGIPIFATAIQKCHKVIEPMGVHLTQIVTEPDSTISDSILHSSVGIAAMQVGLTDLLKAVGIEPDHIIGHGAGELGCAYADGCLTAEQTILAAYWCGRARAETPRVEESMTTQLGPNLFKYLKDVIQDPKPRSKRWVSTSVPQQVWNDEIAKLSCAEYLVNSLVNPVQFEEVDRLIQPGAVAIEVAPHGLLQNALSRSLNKDVVNIPLMQKGHEDNIKIFLTGLGKLYEVGLNPHLAEIYPHVEFPVSIGTPMMSHLVEWEHSEDWYVDKYQTLHHLKSNERIVDMCFNEELYEYMLGHVVDGRNLFPATGYLFMVWETLSMIKGIMHTELSVVFENVRFLRATNIPKVGRLYLTITIQGSGNFEVLESGTAIVTGCIRIQKDVGQSYRALPPASAGTSSSRQMLLQKDFYKELRLRGYQYSGMFRGVIFSNIKGTRGRLAWVDNWVTFMDSMMQLKIIGVDTRALLVPTRIDRLAIDTDIHYKSITRLAKKESLQSLEVHVYPYSGIIRSGGVEISGLHASNITRRAPPGEPVLEKYLFVPYFGDCKMKIEDILRVDIHLLRENLNIHKVKSIELVDEEYKKNGFEPLIEQVGDIVGDLPLMQSELLVISEETIEMPPHITVENKKISGETNVALFIGANMLSRPDILQQAFLTLKEKCFIMSREKEPPNPKAYAENYDIVTIHDAGSEYVVLFRKKIVSKPAKFINIATADETFSWIEPVKEKLKEEEKIVLYAQNERNVRGILGFINCLKRETGGETLNGMLIDDKSAPPFNSDLELYSEQLEKDLVQNVLRDGQWGTYRYLLLGDLDTVQTDHAYVNTLTIGDLSSMRWLEGPLKQDSSVTDSSDDVLIHVYYAALNFRDVMAATGRLPLDTENLNRLGQECEQGLEVVGRTNNGSRVMCMIEKGMSTVVQANKSTIWGIPDEWTFEEAVTVPVVYATVYVAMVMVGKIQAGESILIHAGSGGVGQAAINVALHFGCEVFTTVGTAEKRAFIKKLFPALKDSHIGNSRDASFENMIRKETNGEGVDLVLNSLSAEILLASVRCLGYRGRFLEIGKYDIGNNTPIGMLLAAKEISFHGIMAKDIRNWPRAFINRMHDLILSGIESGAVRPLTRCTFEKDQIESAFRYMAAGKHIGKLIIKIRDEETSKIVKPTRMLIDAVPRYMCTADAVYVVIGGLGGFGLELADWLVLRGARRLLLSSRGGLVNGYQASRMRAWASYGAQVEVSTHDVTSEVGCEEMLQAAGAMGPVHAVFNLAVVLKDATFQNQTPEMFKSSFAPKALVTMHLDKLTRRMCPKLKDFVVFSSVVCGRGNPGQTNYGFSNAVMEHVCERRKQRGLPALAVQWGAVGDVGIVAEMIERSAQKLDIGGTLQQGISSCLLTLDKFLKQDAAVVSSIVVAEKKVRGTGTDTLVHAVAHIMGIKDLKTVSFQVSLADMGMDSMMGVEIKQTLEREFEVFLTAQDIRTLTFARLVELSAKGDKSSTTDNPREDVKFGLGTLVKNFDEEHLFSLPFIYMSTVLSEGTENMESKKPPIFMMPGLEGAVTTLEQLCRGLQRKACVLQLGVEHPGENIEAMVNRLFQTVRTILAPGEPFTLLGYSFGCYLMLELAAKLESEGHENGLVFCVDGSPEFICQMLSSWSNFKNTAQLQNLLICQTMDVVAPNNGITIALFDKISKMETYEDKVKCAIEMSSIQSTKYTPKFVSQLAGVVYDRLKVILNFNLKDIKKIQAPIVLIRTKQNMPNIVCDANYGLDKFTHSTVTVHYLESNHVTILDNEECTNIINKVLVANDNLRKVTLELKEQNVGS